MSLAMSSKTNIRTSFNYLLSFQTWAASFKKKTWRSITRNQNPFYLERRNSSCLTVFEENRSRNQKVVIKRESEERNWLKDEEKLKKSWLTTKKTAWLQRSDQKAHQHVISLCWEFYVLFSVLNRHSLIGCMWCMKNK